MADLMMFYGTECTHCHTMFPLIDQLKEETGKEVEKLEIWHDSKNRKIFDECNDQIHCTAVPFFFNKKTKKGICGGTSYEKLKEWATE